MGSDLSIGRVVGNDLQCAFHHWQYGPDGRCSLIPTGDRIPNAARLFSFPTEERYGIIWVFLGVEPLYQVPTFPGDVDESTLLIRSFEAQFSAPLRIDPWVFTSNTFDLVHNRVVHGIQINDPEVEWITPYVAAFQWDAEFKERAIGTWHLDIRVFGTNAQANSGIRGDRMKHQVAGGCPMGSAGNRMFFAVATPDSPGAPEYLEEQEALHNRLVNEDFPIMNTLRLGDDHFVASDREIVRYLRFVRDYPRTTVAALEASAAAK
jgi:phenylpropionate dioxygenase-like ring-hydroxylating dioxygenase large terminal subunit